MGRKVIILNTVDTKVTEEVTFEQTIKGGEGVSQMGEEFTQQGTCQYRGRKVPCELE